DYYCDSWDTNGIHRLF
nr:immunoglobulin light chain junction region [Macaca mulatta]